MSDVERPKIREFQFDAEVIPLRLDRGPMANDHPGIPIGLLNWYARTVWLVTRRTMLSLSRQGITARDAVRILLAKDYKTAPESSVRRELDNHIAEFNRLGSIEYAYRFAGARYGQPDSTDGALSKTPPGRRERGKA